MSNLHPTFQALMPIAPLPEGKMLFEGEVVDSSESCDVDYACTFPPCVAERDAEAAQWLARFNAASDPIVLTSEVAARYYDGYEQNDPKRSDFMDRLEA